MRSPVDEQLIDQAARFRLRFGCEDCAHHDPQTQRCSAGYPNDEHLGPALASGASLCFCKSFELR